jgi:arsenate reductase
MKILFMCVSNSARSQMAEAMARKILGSRVEVRSAGSVPSGQVHPRALEVLKEAGADASRLKSKSIDRLELAFLREVDFVITLCSEEVCPRMPGEFQRLEWPIPDPAALPENQQLDAFRSARDFIAKKLEMFNAALRRCEDELR